MVVTQDGWERDQEEKRKRREENRKIQSNDMTMSDWDRITQNAKSARIVLRRWGVNTDCCDVMCAPKESPLLVQKAEAVSRANPQDAQGHHSSHKGHKSKSPPMEEKASVPKCLLTANEELLWACARGDVIRAKDCLAKGASPDSHDQQGYHPLHFACAAGSPEIVKILVGNTHNAQVNVTNTAGVEKTPVWFAAERGEVEIVQLLDKEHDALEHETLPSDWPGWSELLPEIGRGSDFGPEQIPKSLWPQTKHEDNLASQYPDIFIDTGTWRARRRNIREYLEGREWKPRQASKPKGFSDAESRNHHHHHKHHKHAAGDGEGTGTGTVAQGSQDSEEQTVTSRPSLKRGMTNSMKERASVIGQKVGGLVRGLTKKMGGGEDGEQDGGGKKVSLLRAMSKKMSLSNGGGDGESSGNGRPSLLRAMTKRVSEVGKKKKKSTEEGEEGGSKKKGKKKK